MYATLSSRLPKLAATLICAAIEALAIVLVVLLSDTPFGAFSYMKL
ncbi:hypothetical protein QO010_003544 [Caulobacter ginsengisoli]|uniref:Uncharacterized protein n=1 Tax=Caulobacter ginsengisoli TaxID=400775 RepID=A0ABU0IXS1_9CAUL|nr:hypothetical protein [Caulobacter ginsengisoli]MDQ0465752.1 hypothetical protein [Caulobacter ginsengisoli]